jgi:1-acyl-sn-glycerol-3-phosphate acyltransferase
VVYRISVADLYRLPMDGPAILLSNHTSNVEGPLYYVFMAPRKATALGKVELWNNILTRFLMNTWDVIPVRRGRLDRPALERARLALANGEFLGIAPEGTRSKSGTLQRGQPGAALLASDASAPVYPVVTWGLREPQRAWVRLRRPRAYLRMGKPFRVRIPHADGPPKSSDIRAATEEMMVQLAVLLPRELRGAYADRQPSWKYLEALEARDTPEPPAAASATSPSVR